MQNQIANQVTAKAKRKWEFPHVFVILFAIVVISMILTYVLPANTYDFALDAEGNPTRLIIPDSYHSVAQSSVNPWAMMVAIPKGMSEAADIIFFLFIVPGAFTIVQATGAIEAGIRALIRKTKGKEALLVLLVTAIFSFGGTSFGMCEEILVFIPMLVPLSLAIGYDSIVGLAIALVGAGAGFTAAFLNPYTEAIAQGVVGLPVFSGMTYRIIIWIFTTLLSMFFIYRYARKIKKDPTKSEMYELDKAQTRVDLESDTPFTPTHKIILLVFLTGLAILIYGVNKWGWYLYEIAALFLVIGLVSGVLSRIPASKMSQLIIDGASGMTMAALVIGLARAILVVLRDGSILHTIVHGMAAVVAGLPPSLSAIGMYVMQIIISVVIPSGSGMAMVTMPIMGPLATLLGLTQQTAVLIYQFADGFTNIIIPTSGYFLGALALAKIPYVKWVKWYTPLFVLYLVSGAVFVIIAQIMKFGPF